MAQLVAATLAGVAPASVTYNPNYVDQNQVGYLVSRSSTTEASTSTLSFRNWRSRDPKTQVTKIKSNTRMTAPRLGTDPVMGEVVLDQAYFEGSYTFPVTWTRAQKDHFIKLVSSAQQNPQVCGVLSGDDKPF